MKGLFYYNRRIDLEVLLINTLICLARSLLEGTNIAELCFGRC